MKLLGCLALGVALGGCTSTPSSKAPITPNATVKARVGHVFIIVLENQPFDTTFGAQSPAPYLAHELTAQGALLRQYFGIGHLSLDNYLALISGQAPSPATHADCHVFSEFVPTRSTLDSDGQLRGTGCMYPASVKTIADRLEAVNLTWKGYMEDMGKDPASEATGCGHVAIGTNDVTTGRRPTTSTPTGTILSSIFIRSSTTSHAANSTS